MLMSDMVTTLDTALNSVVMTSSEPRRMKAYAEDLRWKIIWQSQGKPKDCCQKFRSGQVNCLKNYKSFSEHRWC